MLILQDFVGKSEVETLSLRRFGINVLTHYPEDIVFLDLLSAPEVFVMTILLGPYAHWQARYHFLQDSDGVEVVIRE